MILTVNNIKAGTSYRGGWSKAQLSILGIKWPLKKGWLHRLAGKKITQDEYDRFLSLKDKHLGAELSKLIEQQQKDIRRDGWRRKQNSKRKYNYAS